MTDFALVRCTYFEQVNWYFVPVASRLNFNGTTMELDMDATEDGTRYHVQTDRMESLFLPANIEILSELRKLIHDIPEPRIQALDENGRLTVDMMPTNISFTERDTSEFMEIERCNNPECCPPIAEDVVNLTWDRDAAVRNLCRDDAILLGLCTRDQEWPPPVEETE